MLHYLTLFMMIFVTKLSNTCALAWKCKMDLNHIDVHAKEAHRKWGVQLQSWALWPLGGICCLHWVFFRPTALKTVSTDMVLMCFPLCFELKILVAEVANSLQSSSRASSTSHHSKDDLMQFHHTNAIRRPNKLTGTAWLNSAYKEASNPDGRSCSSKRLHSQGCKY